MVVPWQYYEFQNRNNFAVENNTGRVMRTSGLIVFLVLGLVLAGCNGGDDSSGGSGGGSSTPPSITTTTLPGGTAGTSYSQTLAATGGTTPYTWGVFSGALPPGTALSTAGLISGTPTAGGTFNFTAIALDSAALGDTQALSIAVAPGVSLPDITTTSLPDGELGSAYSANVAATGGTMPYTFTVTSGALPNGLALSTAGALSGTPTVLGTFNFTVQVSDNASNTDSQALSIEVVPAIGPLAIVARNPNNGTNVAPTDCLRMTFNRGLDPATVNVTATVSVLGGPSTALAGTATVITPTNTDVVFSAASALPLDAVITVNFAAGLQSFNGVTPTGAVSAQFSTLATSALYPDSNLGRSSMACVTLLDGRVMMTGGNVSSVGQTSCIIFNPTTNAWTTTGSLVAGRYSHTAVVLDNGDVAVIGGQASGSVMVNTVEVWNSTTGVWATTVTLLPRTLSANVFRHASGRWIVVAGMTTPTTTAGIQTAIEVLSTNMTVLDFTSASVCNSGGFATQLSNGDIVVAGREFTGPGTSIDGSSVTVIDVNPASTAGTDPVTSSTLYPAVLPNAVSTPTLEKFAGDDRVLSFSNATGNIGDLSILTVNYSGTAPTSVTRLAGPPVSGARARNFVTMNRTPDGGIIIGPGAPTGMNALPAADVYLPAAIGLSGTLTPLTVAPRRSYHSATLQDGRVLFIGGRSGGLTGPLRFDSEAVSSDASAQGSLTARPPICIASVPTSGTRGFTTTTTSVRLIFSGELEAATAVNGNFEWSINGGAFTAPASVQLQNRREVVIQLPAATALVAGNTVVLRLKSPTTLTDRAPTPNTASTTRGAFSNAWTVR